MPGGESCANCGRNRAGGVRHLCRECGSQLPPATLAAYNGKLIGREQAVEALRLCRASVRVLRGGKHTPGHRSARYVDPEPEK
jgi:hypothetical protein